MYYDSSETKGLFTTTLSKTQDENSLAKNIDAHQILYVDEPCSRSYGFPLMQVPLPGFERHVEQG